MPRTYSHMSIIARFKIINKALEMILIKNISKIIYMTFIGSSALYALTPSQVFDTARDSIVVIYAYDDNNKKISQGSGVLLSAQQIATNCHVLEDGSYYAIKYHDKMYKATFYAGDINKDTCLLVSNNIKGKPATIGKSTNLTVGEKVYAIGAPEGMELSLSDGIVSQLRGKTPPIIQTTAAISHGSSGGGLFNSKGELVGLTTSMIKEGQNLNFAMPVEYLFQIKPYKKIQWAEEALKLQKKKQWKPLLKLSQLWAETESYNDDAYISLANAYKNLNMPNEAIEAYKKALEIDDNNDYAWEQIGNQYYKLEKYAASKTAFQNALDINPNNEYAWIGLGNCGGYEDAVTAYYQALLIDSQNITAWKGIEVAYSNFVDTSDQLDMIDKLQVLSPKHSKKVIAIIKKKSIETVDIDPSDIVVTESELEKAFDPNKVATIERKSLPKKEFSLYDNFDGLTITETPKKSSRSTTIPTDSVQKLYGDKFGELSAGEQKYILDNHEAMRRITQGVLNRYGESRIPKNFHANDINMVEFYLHPDGSISGMKLLKNSQYSILDDTTRETIEIAYKDYPRPEQKTYIRYRVWYNLNY